MLRLLNILLLLSGGPFDGFCIKAFYSLLAMLSLPRTLEKQETNMIKKSKQSITMPKQQTGQKQTWYHPVMSNIASSSNLKAADDTSLWTL